MRIAGNAANLLDSTPACSNIVRMSERPFPKPPAADPLPLEIWLDQTDRSEVGREPFFRGRDMEFDVFRRAVGSLHDGRVGGGTMVFQGAPGAVSRLLGEFLDRGRQILHEIPDRNVSLGGVSWSGREREVSAEGLFEHAAPLLGRFHIVVCVDEAQNTPVGDMTRDALDCLHRDPQGIPLVAAFFGLSDTTRVLRRCGLSGFARGRVVTLEPLPHEDSARAIRDAFAAYGFTGAPEHREAWVNRLAELSKAGRNISTVSRSRRPGRHTSGNTMPAGWKPPPAATGFTGIWPWPRKGTAAY